jgi:hypothetical protein
MASPASKRSLDVGDTMPIDTWLQRTSRQFEAIMSWRGLKRGKLELPLEKKEQEKAAYLPFPVTEDSSDIPPMPHANASTPTKKIFIPVLFAACSFFFVRFRSSRNSLCWFKNGGK